MWKCQASTVRAARPRPPPSPPATTRSGGAAPASETPRTAATALTPMTPRPSKRASDRQYAKSEAVTLYFALLISLCTVLYTAYIGATTAWAASSATVRQVSAYIMLTGLFCCYLSGLCYSLSRCVRRDEGAGDCSLLWAVCSGALLPGGVDQRHDTPLSPWALR